MTVCVASLDGPVTRIFWARLGVLPLMPSQGPGEPKIRAKFVDWVLGVPTLLFGSGSLLAGSVSWLVIFGENPSSPELPPARGLAVAGLLITLAGAYLLRSTFLGCLICALLLLASAFVLGITAHSLGFAAAPAVVMALVLVRMVALPTPDDQS